MYGGRAAAYRTVDARTARPAADLEAVKKMIGRQDAILVTDFPDGRVLISKNENRPLIPASTLKIFTALVRPPHSRVRLPLRDRILLRRRRQPDHQGLWRPGAYFRGVGGNRPQLGTQTAAHQEHHPGRLLLRSASGDPRHLFFFRTVRRSQRRLVRQLQHPCSSKKKTALTLSAEPQTPLLPMVLGRITSSGLNEGRIVLSHNENEITLYCGYLSDHFLRQAGVTVTGKVADPEPSRPGRDHLIYRHLSPLTLSDSIARLLAFSNNYTTNQILISAGARRYGPPGTLEKGVQVAREYARNILQLSDIHISGVRHIARQPHHGPRHAQSARCLRTLPHAHAQRRPPVL